MIPYNAGILFNEMLPQILSERPELSRRIHATLGVELSGPTGGYWTIDLTDIPSVEQGQTKKPDATITMHVDEFNNLIANGSVREALDAYKQKRIQTSGHLPTILKVEGIIRELVKKAA